MDHTGFDFFDEAQDGVDVFRENRSGEAVLDTIREGERFFQIFCGGYRQHRPEHLFFEDPHLRIDIVKDGRFDEIAFAEMFRLFAAQNQPCAFVLSNLDVVEIGFPLFLIDGGAHIDRFIQTRPDFNFFCGFDETLDERVLHLGMSDHARCRRAALPGGAESAAVNGHRGFVEVGVRHDDDGVLAAHLAGYLCAALRRFGIKRAADLVGSGE